MRSQLAVCVPTHEGRARAVDELLTRLAAEAGMEDVEICVSDHDSTGATAELVARHRSTFGGRLRYARYEPSGMAENVLRVIELSDADYCWLMGSDDAPAQGSIARVRMLLNEHVGVSGLALGLKRVDAHDLARPAGLVPPEPFPSQRGVTRIRGRREVAESVGYVTFFTSCNVIHRCRWQAVIGAERDAALSAGCAPHMYVTARMAASHPDWVWCPEPLVLSRAAPVYLEDADELGNHPAAVVRSILLDLDTVWASAYGRYSYIHRALMFKALRHNWNSEAIFEQRRQAHGPRELFATLSCARRFWWSRRFWRHHLPLLVMPVTPLRYTDDGRRPFAMGRISESDRRVSLDGSLPEVMTTGYADWVTVRVVNRGSVSLSSAGPHPVVLATRWHDATSGVNIDVLSHHATIWPPLRPGSSRAIELLVSPPWEAGTYILTVAAAQPGIGWFDDQSLEGHVRVDSL